MMSNLKFKKGFIKSHKIKGNCPGFTVIELLVTIAIIGLLSTLAVVSLSGARAKARDAKRLSDMRSLQSAIELRKIDNDDKTDEVPMIIIWDIVLDNLSKYLSNGLPVDPDNAATPYVYCSKGGSKFLIAADLEDNTAASAGTGGINTALSNWDTDNCIESNNGNPPAVPACAANDIFCLGYANGS